VIAGPVDVVLELGSEAGPLDLALFHQGELFQRTPSGQKGNVDDPTVLTSSSRKALLLFLLDNAVNGGYKHIVIVVDVVRQPSLLQGEP